MRPWTDSIRRRREMVLEGPRARSEPRRLLRSAGADAADRAAPNRSRGRHDQGDGGQESQVRPGVHLSLAVFPRVLASRRTPTTSRKPWSWPPMIPKCCSPRLSSASRNRTRLPLGSISRRAPSSIPRHADFALGLARLEMREGHLDRAESVLRQAFEATHSIDAAFEVGGKSDSPREARRQGPGSRLYQSAAHAGLGDTLVPFLEARILVQQKKWTRQYLGSRRPERCWDRIPDSQSKSISCWPMLTAAWVPTSSV